MAIKVIDIESAEDEVEDIVQEIAILAELQSPYVTQYYGSYAKGSELWIVMEFCAGGSCADLMKPGLIGEEYIAIILRELLMGLDYLHGDKKLHRDVKGMYGVSTLSISHNKQPGTCYLPELADLLAPSHPRPLLTDAPQPQLPTYCSAPTAKSSLPTLASRGSSRRP